MTQTVLLSAFALLAASGADTRGPGTISSHELPALNCSQSETFVERKDGERQTVVRCWTKDDDDTQAWRDASMGGGYRSIALTFADAAEAPLALTSCRITSTLTFGSGDATTVRVGLVCAGGAT